MLLVEVTAVYCKKHMKHKNILCGQNAEFKYAKIGAYSNHCTWKG